MWGHKSSPNGSYRPNVVQKEIIMDRYIERERWDGGCTYYKHACTIFVIRFASVNFALKNVLLFTCILLDALITHITLYLTTPLKFASALPLFIQLVSIIAASATQYITIIDTATHCTITRSADSAQWADTQVTITIIRRWIQMN